jgi:hypothetical protein
VARKKVETTQPVDATTAERALPTERSERVVVDELFDDGSARLLRARHLFGCAPGDLSIGTWGEEREDFLASWLVEAFVGFTGTRRLAEGDVFFLVDGDELSDAYRGEAILPRRVAATKHLLVPVDQSVDIARREIKEASFILTAVAVAPSASVENALRKQVKERVKR